MMLVLFKNSNNKLITVCIFIIIISIKVKKNCTERATSKIKKSAFISKSLNCDLHTCTLETINV